MLRVSLVQRNKARNIMTWYARIFDTETKEIRYESTGTTKKTEAQCLMQAKLSDGEFEERNNTEVSVGQAIDAYLRHLESRGAGRFTLRFTESSLSTIADLRSVPLSHLSRKLLYDTFTANCEGICPATFNVRRSVVRTCFKYAIGYYGLEIANPADVIQSRKSQQRERDFWTPEQIDAILDKAPSPMYRMLWALMAFAGLRIHEAMKATPMDVRDGYIFVCGKGGKYAKVPVSSRLQDEMDRVGGFWNFKGLNSDYRKVRTAARLAIPEGFHGTANNHRFRHSFASNLLRNGCNPKSVQKLMRHATINITLQIYSHVMDDDLRSDIEKMFA